MRLLRKSCFVVTALLLSGCEVPQKTVVLERNGEQYTCGPSKFVTIAFGAIGQVIENAANEDCVTQHIADGWKIKK